jgi:hypothetical protein
MMVNAVILVALSLTGGLLYVVYRGISAIIGME